MEFKEGRSQRAGRSSFRINRNIMEFKGTSGTGSFAGSAHRINRNIMEFKVISVSLPLLSTYELIET